MMPSHSPKAATRRRASSVRSRTSGEYIGSTRSEPDIMTVSAPASAAACRLMAKAFSLLEPARVVPPMPSILSLCPVMLQIRPVEDPANSCGRLVGEWNRHALLDGAPASNQVEPTQQVRSVAPWLLRHIQEGARDRHPWENH